MDNTFSELQQQIDSLSPIRKVIKTLSGDTTVITYADNLGEAIYFFVKQLSSISAFFLIDKASHEIGPAPYGVNVVGNDAPLPQNPDLLCVYTTPRHDFWAHGGLWGINDYMVSHNRPRYQIPETVVRPMRALFSGRPEARDYVQSRRETIRKCEVSLNVIGLSI